MHDNEVFNVTVCILGILIFLVHVVNIIFKKNKREDEMALFVFIAFTIIHFSIYLLYTFIHINYTSDNFVKSFYTLFYIMNNLEVYFLFIYVLKFISLDERINKKLNYINNILFLIMLFLDIINIFTGFFFYAENGMYIRSKTMIISQFYQFIMLFIVFVITLINKKLNLREKISFAIYCIIPLLRR